MKGIRSFGWKDYVKPCSLSCIEVKSKCIYWLINRVFSIYFQEYIPFKIHFYSLIIKKDIYIFIVQGSIFLCILFYYRVI